MYRNPISCCRPFDRAWLHGRFSRRARWHAGGGTGILYRPELLVVEEIARFEGISDPADEAIVLALHCREDGIKGTYTVAFGPGMGALDAEMMHRLRDAITTE